MIIRAATSGDAPGMSRLLTDILTGWGSSRPGDPDHVDAFYIHHQNKVSCLVAVADDHAILGFQSLKRAGPENIYGVTPGWGVIGTYVDQAHSGQGTGAALFAATADAARTAGLRNIDATIGAGNATALAYYSAMGFETYKTGDKSVSKVFRIC